MGRTFSDDAIILGILERNLGKNNAQKVLKTLSGTYDADSIILKLQKTLKGRIPETRLEKMLKEFSDAQTMLPETKHEEETETKEHGTLAGRKYDIKKEIGRGGMGAVYRVEETSLEREVAMKKIIGAPNDARVRRFIREAKITGKLEHPNIVAIHDFGVNEAGEYYFTMKYVKGEDLKEILEKIDDKDSDYPAKYTLNKRLNIFNNILDALAFAHSKGIVHRDLKPANIMVGKFGEVQVMDWGLAKDNSKEDIVSEGKIKTTKEGLTLEGQVMGSPGFMAPEQADGRIEDVDELSDIWSLGAILYNMLSFEKPVEGDSVRDVVTNTAKGKITPLGKKAKRVPKELESIVMKALSPEKEDRYQSVEELHEDVDAFLERRPVSAHRYGITEKINKWIQRHPTAAISCGVGVVLLSISGVVGGLLYQQTQTAKEKAKTETVRADQATLEKTAAELEVKGQQQCEAILNSLKFLKQDAGFYESACSIIDDAVDESKDYWKPYLVLAKHQASFGRHEEAEKLFEKANELFKKQFNKDSVEIFFEAGMHYGLPTEIGGKGEEERALTFFEKAYSADPDGIFGKLSKAVALVIKTKKSPVDGGRHLPKANELSKELTEDVVAKNIDATWLVRAWVCGIGQFSLTPETERSVLFWEYINLPEAKNALLHVVSENHGDIKIRNLLATIYSKLDEHDKALQIFSDINNIENTCRSHLNLGLAYEKKNEPKKAMEDYNTAINLDPKHKEAFFFRGGLHYKLGNLEKAIENFSTAISLDPNDCFGYQTRAYFYTQKGELEKAIEDYSTLINRDPKNIDYRRFRAGVFESMHETEKAMQDYNTIVELDPKDPNGYSVRGGAFRRMNLFKKAMTDYDTAVNLDPGNANAYLGKGFVFSDLGETSKAIIEFNKAIDLEPNHLSAYAHRGFAYESIGELDKAKEDYEKAKKIFSGIANIFFSSGSDHLAEGKLEKAIKELTIAIRLDENHARSYNNRADCYMHLDKLLEAESDAQKAISLGDKLAYVTLGEIHMKKGEYDKALLAFKDAYEKAPEHKDVIDKFMEELKQKIKEKE